MSEKKMGRPTDSVKNTRLTVRLDDDTFKKLDNYCNKNNIGYSKGIRDGINKLDKNSEK